MDVLNAIPSAAGGSVTPLAPRPKDLRGKRIGILDNSKPNADALLGRVAELLVERRSRQTFRGRADVRGDARGHRAHRGVIA